MATGPVDGLLRGVLAGIGGDSAEGERMKEDREHIDALETLVADVDTLIEAMSRYSRYGGQTNALTLGLQIGAWVKKRNELLGQPGCEVSGGETGLMPCFKAQGHFGAHSWDFAH